MKKEILLTIAIAFGFSTFAQEHYKANTQKEETNFVLQTDNYTPTKAPLQNVNATKATSSVVIGQSSNVYSFMVDHSTCLTANNDLGLIQLTARGKVGENGATDIGDIMAYTSVDNGVTWAAALEIAGTAASGNRYPSGVIYNPTGNTTVSNAFSVYAGPVTNGTNWINNFFGSTQINGTNKSNIYIPTNGGELIRNGMCTTNDGKIHIIGSSYHTVGTNGVKLDSIYLATGTFNTTNNNFDWTVSSFTHNFFQNTDGSDFAFVTSFNTAWSSDGTVGYYWTTGRDSSLDTRANMPIVWKTTNSGATWDMMPVFDFSTLPIMQEYLFPLRNVTPLVFRPQFFSAIDGVVDANNNLHLIAQVQSALSDNSDSLDYYTVPKYAPVPILDCYTTATGWDARHLGGTYTVYVPAAESGFGSGTDAQGWDLRVQAGKSADGTKIFASWTDTDTLNAPLNTRNARMNQYPDLYVASWDINTLLQTNPTNFTVNTPAAGICYYHYSSNIILSNNGNYEIPTTFVALGNTPADPVTVNYLKGVSFKSSDYVTNPGIKINAENNMVISQNYPNPFTGETTIEINLKKSSNVVFKVMNIAGQKVYESNLGNVVGKHTINFNSSNLNSGVYFYTVRNNEYSVTKKMIIK